MIEVTECIKIEMTNIYEVDEQEYMEKSHKILEGVRREMMAIAEEAADHATVTVQHFIGDAKR